MIQYKCHRAASLDDVVKVLKEYGDRACIVAGRTNIMVQIHERDRRWRNLQCLLDITCLDKELCYTSQDKEYVYIDPLSTHTDLKQSEIIVKHIPFLGWTSATVGSLQIRNRETLGGNIGNTSPAFNPFPISVAADVFIKVYGQDGERVYLLKDFYKGKGNFRLRPGEFVREFAVKKLPKGVRMGLSKLSRRKALAISRPNCAVAPTMDSEGTITEARIAPGCIFILPDRVERAEQVLIGQEPSEELFAKAGKTVSEAMMERTGVHQSIQYKEPAVQEIILRALCQVAGIEVQQWRR